MSEQNLDQQGQQGQVQPGQGAAKKQKKDNPLKKAYGAVDAGALVLVLSAPMILLSRFFWSISSGETGTRDIYKLALQNAFIGLFISIVFEKPHVCFASAAGSIVFLTFNYIINPSIEHSDALTDTFKSFRRYSASTIMNKLANLLPLITVTQSFEDEYNINRPKTQRVVIRRERPTEDPEDEVVEDEIVDDNILEDVDLMGDEIEEEEEATVESNGASVAGMPPQVPPLPPMPTGPPGLPPNMTPINMPPNITGLPPNMPGMPPLPPNMAGIPPNMPGMPPLGMSPAGMPATGLPPLGEGMPTGPAVTGLPPLGGTPTIMSQAPTAPLDVTQGSQLPPLTAMPGMVQPPPPPGGQPQGSGIGGASSVQGLGMPDPISQQFSDIGLPMGQLNNAKPTLKPPRAARDTVAKPVDPAHIQMDDDFV